jgi:hypothetical protein
MCFLIALVDARISQIKALAALAFHRAEKPSAKLINVAAPMISENHSQ